MVRDRIDEQLERQRGAAAVARHQRDGRGEVAAGAVAGDDDAARIDAQVCGVRGHPLQRRVAVVQPGRKLVFRREAIVDGHHLAAHAVGERAAGGVVAVEVAGDPAAAVQPDQQRERAGARVTRRVRAGAHGLAVAAGQVELLDRADHLLGWRQQVLRAFACDRDSQLGDGRAFQGVDGVDEGLGLGMQGHGAGSGMLHDGSEGLRRTIACRSHLSSRNQPKVRRLPWSSRT